MSFVTRLFKEGTEPTLFGKGYDAQFEFAGHAPELCDEEGLLIWRDVPYVDAEDAHPLQRMDVFRPADDDDALPALVFLHGGGWRAGDKRDASHVYENLAVAIAKRGWVVANANYRLAPDHGWRDQAADAASVIACLAGIGRQFNADESRIVVSGHSAGGHLAALIALDPQWLQAAGVPEGSLRGVAPVSGVFDIADFAESGQNMRWMVKPAFGTDSAEWGDASPLSWVASEASPFYIVTGERDEERIVGQAQRLADLLEEAGVQASLVRMPGADHFSVLSRVSDPAYQLVDYLATFADTVVGGARAERDYDAARGDRT